MRLLERLSDGGFRLTKKLLDNEIPPYAILSHAWGSEEVTFEDMDSDSNRSKAGFEKIRFCREQAATDGLQYFWVDTCCIKKSNDAELSESLNSMFRWYQNAKKCYVYLSDVSMPSDASTRKWKRDQNSQKSWEQAFRASKWFTRGWTLQELLAPQSVEFFSKEGSQLGNKRSLEQLIHEITDIPIPALQTSDLSPFSIDQKFNWAKDRQTTREEDWAYSLLGIFRVSMPVIYGEGKANAVRRLKREIDDVLGERLNNDVDYHVDLPVVASALFDSFDDQHIPLCQHGTRIGILEKITAWILNDMSETILWVHSPAGTGKSTISRTISRQFANSNLLAASYFFRRGEKSRNGTALLFPTLAHCLMVTVPGFKKCLWESMEESGRSNIDKKSLETQFDILILTPLSRISPAVVVSSPTSTKAIVIDGLDECEDEASISIIYRQFSKLQTLHTVRLRVLLTSRYTTPIVNEAHRFKDEDISCRSLPLQEEYAEDTKADIVTFIKQKLLDIKKERQILKEPWPELSDLNRLIDLATTPSPLFIYAATLCRFIDDGSGRLNPMKRLRLWLNQCSNGISQLSQLYLPIFRDLPLDEEDREELLQIIGSITMLATPLPAQSLTSLLGLDEDDVNHWLRNLHAVLDRPASPNIPIRLLHKSFTDFILGEEAAEFQVDAAIAHALLAKKCIECMENYLREDICNLHDPSTLVDEINKATIARYIPPGLEYACLYWIYHIQQSVMQSEKRIDFSRIYDFLKVHFLHWIETLSLMGKASHSLNITKSLQPLFTPDKHSELMSLIDDMRRFILKHREAIEMAPLQLYSSALLFSPETSRIRQMFLDQRKLGIKMPPPEKSWDSALWTIPVPPRCMVLSPDGILLAVASHLRVTLHDVTTGEILKILDHLVPVDHMVFSPDSRVLASSHNGIYWCWDSKSGTLLQRSEISYPNSIVVFAIGFSHQDLLFVLKEGNRLHVRNITQATSLPISDCLRYPVQEINSVVFSPDCNVIAFVTYRSIQLWCTVTRRSLRLFARNTEDIWNIAFSPDGQILASVSSCGTVCIWETKTGADLKMFKVDIDWRGSICFSSNDVFLTKRFDTGKIIFWDVQAGIQGALEVPAHLEFSKPLVSSESHTLVCCCSTTIRCWNIAPETIFQYTLPQTPINSFKRNWGTFSIMTGAFTSDRLLFASGSNTGIIMFWDPTTGRTLRTLKGHDSAIRALAFSPDGQVLASASSSDPLQLWDVQSGKAFKRLPSYSLAVAFSPDGRVLSSVSGGLKRIKELAFRYIVLLDAVTGVELRRFPGPGYEVGKLYFLSNEQLIAIFYGLLRNRYQLAWNTQAGSIYRTQKESPDNIVLQITFSSDGRLLASSSANYLIQLWDYPTMSQRQTLEGHTAPISTIDFSRDGRLLASGSDDHQVKIWDTTAGTVLYTLLGHRSTVFKVLFAPNSDFLASGAMDGTIQLWNSSNDNTSTIETEDSSYELVDLAFSSNGDLTAVALSTHKICLWNPVTKNNKWTANYNPVKMPLFSTNGRLLAIVSFEIIQVWDFETGESIGNYDFNVSARNIVLSPDCGCLACGLSNGDILLWDFLKKEERKVLHGHSKQATALSFLPDSTVLASGYLDGTIRLWDSQHGVLLQTVENDSRPIQLTKMFLDDKSVDSDSSLESLLADWRFEVKTLGQKPQIGMSIDSHWVTRNGHKFLFLPIDCQPSGFTIEGNVIALGLRSGKVIFIELIE